MPKFTAVVHDAHGARFVAAARSQREREARVVDYIRERYDYVLWPSAAANVRKLIAHDRKSDAIVAYFANVGQRWDDERLSYSTVMSSERGGVYCRQWSRACPLVDRESFPSDRY